MGIILITLFIWTKATIGRLHSVRVQRQLLGSFCSCIMSDLAVMEDLLLNTRLYKIYLAHHLRHQSNNTAMPLS